MNRDRHSLSKDQRRSLENIGVVLCYLHGSVEKGDARADSDVDVAVLFDRAPEDSVKATADVIAAIQGFEPDRERDVAILNEAGPLLKQAVASCGKILYARSEADSLGFQLRAMHEYEYSRHVVRLGQELALKRAHV